VSSRSICRVPLSVGRRRRKEEGGGSASSEAHLGRGVSSVGRAAFALVTSVERDAPHAMGLEHESIVVCRYMSTSSQFLLPVVVEAGNFQGL
jgi:hypothetical protein